MTKAKIKLTINRSSAYLKDPPLPTSPSPSPTSKEALLANTANCGGIVYNLRLAEKDEVLVAARLLRWQAAGWASYLLF